MFLNHPVLRNKRPHIRKSANAGGSSHSQGGSMLVIALFVIIVLGLLGLTLTQVLSASSQTVVYEVFGQRALNAARAGVEAQIALALPITGGASCSDPPSFTFSNIPGLENCQYDAKCEQKIIVDTGSGVTATYNQFTSTGQCRAGNIIVSRTVYVDAMQ